MRRRVSCSIYEQEKEKDVFGLYVGWFIIIFVFKITNGRGTILS